MRIALDTNVLVYIEVDAGDPRTPEARILVGRMKDAHDLVIPAQAIGELFNVLVRSAGWSRTKARAAIQTWCVTAEITATDEAVMLAASTIAASHGLAIWDAVILAAAAATGCSALLSEDMQHGFTWGGVTVVNPFVRPMHPLLASALASTP